MRPRRENGRRRGTLVRGALAAGALALVLIVAAQAGHVISTVAFGTQHPSSASAPGSAARTAGTFEVPPSIDATGQTDVSADLDAFIASQPDGSTILFPTGATYRIETPITLANRHNLTLSGAATLEATTPPGANQNRDQVRIYGGSGITIDGLSVVGANTTPGAYVPDLQYDTGFHIRGAHDVLIRDVHVRDTYGDCVYVGASGFGSVHWSDTVTFEDSTCAGAGRQGISITGGSNVAVRGVTFSNIGQWALDIEPNLPRPAGGASNVYFDSNTIVDSYLASARGHGRVDHLWVTGNAIRGRGITIRVGVAGSTFRDSDITITGNSSDTAVDGPTMFLEADDHVTVRGNMQPLRSGSLVSQADCTDVVLS